MTVNAYRRDLLQSCRLLLRPKEAGNGLCRLCKYRPTEAGICPFLTGPSEGRSPSRLLSPSDDGCASDCAIRHLIPSDDGCASGCASRHLIPGDYGCASDCAIRPRHPSRRRCTAHYQFQARDDGSAPDPMHNNGASRGLSQSGFVLEPPDRPSRPWRVQRTRRRQNQPWQQRLRALQRV